MSWKLGPKGEVDRESASLALEGDKGDCEHDLVWPRRRLCMWVPSCVLRRWGAFAALASRDDSLRRRTLAALPLLLSATESPEESLPDGSPAGEGTGRVNTYSYSRAATVDLVPSTSRPAAGRRARISATGSLCTLHRVMPAAAPGARTLTL